MVLLSTLLEIGPYHLPTLEVVLASPIVTTFSSCLPSGENDGCLWTTLITINNSPDDWKKESPEIAQSGKRIIQALFLEGFESFIEQMEQLAKDGYYDPSMICLRCARTFLILFLFSHRQFLLTFFILLTLPLIFYPFAPIFSRSPTPANKKDFGSHRLDRFTMTTNSRSSLSAKHRRGCPSKPSLFDFQPDCDGKR
ncbi:hypothetical protein BLNAU_18345 [Blattamonas nauphoetae]|uniref:Uncharacterized protein n=1 Tax=Blattamonas nauphoetae TaxID=2049346 RepID=A0ABQ9X5Z1_9EUKA|nr:hypothetical protein BLNAU_18345 [Blattamonas nauphoetae]